MCDICENKSKHGNMVFIESGHDGPYWVMVIM